MDCDLVLGPLHSGSGNGSSWSSCVLCDVWCVLVKMFSQDVVTDHCGYYSCITHSVLPICVHCLVMRYQI